MKNNPAFYEELYNAFNYLHEKLMEFDEVLSKEEKNVEDGLRCLELQKELETAVKPLLPVVSTFSEHLKPVPTELLVDSVLTDALARTVASSVNSVWEAAPPPEECEGLDEDPLLRVSHYLLLACVVEELMRRQQENEDRRGRLVREFLVHKANFTGETDSAGRTLGAENCRRRLTKYLLWRTAPLPASDSQVEKESIASIHLTSALAPFLKPEPVAMTPKGLTAIVDGKLNRLPARIRDEIRTEIETENRRERISMRYDYDDLDRRQPENAGSAESSARRRLLEIQLQRSNPEKQVLVLRTVEQFMSKLTPRQREFLEIRLQCDTAEQAAGRLGISGSAASQLWKSIKDVGRSLKIYP